MTAINPIFLNKSACRCIVLLFLVTICNAVSAQNIYTLDEIIQFAQSNSPEAMMIKTSKENKYWQWRTYKAAYKPKLMANATLPAYQNQNISVRQPDGSIANTSINQSQAYMNLSLEQNIGFTGGRLFINSEMSRFDDLNSKSKNYIGSPFSIGIEQPLFAFNNLKWMNCIEPIKFEGSQKEFLEGIEQIAYTTTNRYFDLLVSQINYTIALTNKSNADTIYKIGIEKNNLGRISKNELLQLKFGVISAQKSMATASLSMKTTLLNLTSYTGITKTQSIVLALPDSIERFEIDDSLAISNAMDNNFRSFEFKRKLLEARRDAEKARRESILAAQLSLSYGQSNKASSIPGIYANPQTLQTFNVGLSIPILDWGRAKAIRRTAEANLKLTEYTVRQDEVNFRQEVITEIESFRMLQKFIVYASEADKTATERYEIARLRYIAGNISITEYNIALEEKDRAKQDYIIALREYWTTYYAIRILTLYDFDKNKKIMK